MIALEVVLDGELPVRLHRKDLAMCQARVCKAVRAQKRPQVPGDRVDVGCGTLRQTDENESLDDLYVTGLEPVFGGHEILWHPRGRPKRPSSV